MFGMDLELRKMVEDNIASASCQHGTLVGLLVEKGVFSIEEYERLLARVRADIDQTMARYRETGKLE